MTRRSFYQDYSDPGFYHITMHVEEALGHPLGEVEGDIGAPAGSAEAPHVALSAAGAMVEYELLHTITAHYPMVAVRHHVIMPEHLHFIIQVLRPITSGKGTQRTLGHLIAGFKTGCNRRYWEITNQAAKPLDTKAPAPATPAPAASAPAASAPAASAPAASGFAAGSPAASGFAAGSPSAGSPSAGSPSAGSPSAPHSGPKARYSSGRQRLFAPGYCDVIALDAEQLAVQIDYIKNNPRSRLLRSLNRSWMSTKRGGIATALYPAALRGFLQRECPASACTPAILAKLGEQLLMAPDGTIDCDTYGDRQLLTQRLLPVVCHRRDAWRLPQQKARCLEAARSGAVLISARIAKGEQDIMDSAIAAGHPVILITDNGFGDRFHPSTERLALCASHRLLLITPWRYHYPYADSAITVAVCKAMNCLAQALAHQKDNWWQA